MHDFLSFKKKLSDNLIGLVYWFFASEKV